MHVFAHLPHSSAVLLDQTHHQAAAGLAVVRVVILLVQSDHKLRVGPEAVCDASGETTEVGILGGQKVCCERTGACDVMRRTWEHKLAEIQLAKNMTIIYSNSSSSTKWMLYDVKKRLIRIMGNSLIFIECTFLSMLRPAEKALLAPTASPAIFNFN